MTGWYAAESSVATIKPTKKRQRRPQQRPEELGMAALKLFSGRGYHETTYQ